MNALAIAHRAGNSLAALHRANELGADVIECDVHHHRGRLEVRHLKTAGPLPFLWDRWELASATAPRLGLDELLEADRHGTTFMLDLKGRNVATATAVAGLLHGRAVTRPILVCGRAWPVVDAVAELSYVMPVLSVRNRLELSMLLRRLGRGRTPYGVSVHRSLLHPALVRRLREAVDVVMTWPVEDLAALDEVLRLGVNGVISGAPVVLTELRSRREPAHGA